MTYYQKPFFRLTTLLFISVGISACQPQEDIVVETPTVVEIQEVIEINVPVPEELPPTDTLVICMGQEPRTLYLYGGRSIAARNIQQAIYDGPYDLISFSYQPSIFEKLPHLGDGDAYFEPVSVSEGDFVVDETGALAQLEIGMMIRLSTCLTSDCFAKYQGGTILMDQMVVAFTLLPGLMWSDGTPLTSADSVFAFTIASHRDTPTSKYVTSRTESYTALDERSVMWKGIPGFIDPTYYLNYFGPLPEHLLGQYSPIELLQEELATRNPVGWGPYSLEDWIPGESISMVKNPRYFRANEGLPLFDKLVYRFVGKNANDNIASLLTGECDILDQTTFLDDQYELLLELQSVGKLNVFFMPSKFWEHIDFGLHPAAYDDGYSMDEGDRPDFFGDVRTRRAISMCLDRQAVVDQVLYGQANVLNSFLHENHPLYNLTINANGFDPNGGRTLLSEIGWLDENGDGVGEAHGIEGIDEGTPFSIQYWTTNARQRVQASEIFKLNLMDCGIEIKLDYFSFDDFFNYSEDGPVAGRNFDMVQFAYNSEIQPFCDQWLSDNVPGDTNLVVADVPWLVDLLGGTISPDTQAFIDWDIWNHAAYVNSEYDRVCENAVQTLPSEETYEKNYFLTQEIIMEELPMIPLYWRNKVTAARPDICNYHMGQNAIDELWNLEMIAYGSLCD